MTDTAR